MYAPEALNTEAVIDSSVSLITFYQISHPIQPFFFDIGHYPSPLITDALVFSYCEKH